jgi:hypothetical protein
MKKKIEDEIEGWIAAQAPDGSRSGTLGAVIAKRLRDLIQIVECANKVLTAVMQMIQKYSQMIIQTMAKIQAYIAHNLAIIQSLQRDLVNLPNTILLTIIKAINDEIMNLTSSDLVKNATKLLADINALKNNVNGFQGFLANQIAQIRSSIQRLADEIANAEHALTSFNWNVNQANLLSDFLSVASPQEIALMNTINTLIGGASSNYLTGGGSTGTDSQTVIPDQTTLKQAAKDLSSEIASNNANTAFVQANTSAMVYQANKFTAKLNKYVNLNGQTQSMTASLHALDVKNQQVLATGEALATTSFSVDTRTLQYGQSAFSFTMTNNPGTFTSYNGITNSLLMGQINSAQDDMWVDIFTASKPGYLMIGSTPYGAIELDSNIADPDISTGLRLVIDNGLYVIEAYSEDDSDVTTNSYNVNYGKFTTVPLAPTPTTLVYATLQEFSCALNNPMAVNPDKDIVLVTVFGVPVVITNIDDTDYNIGYNGDSWMRYLTQQEIGEMEQTYMTSLTSFSLSPKFNQQTIEVHVGSTRSYSMATDTQLTDLLIGTKPYNGMKIPANSVALQFSKININVNGGSTTLDSVKYPYGIQCDWGYLSEF